MLEGKSSSKSQLEVLAEREVTRPARKKIKTQLSKALGIAKIVGGVCVGVVGVAREGEYEGATRQSICTTSSNNNIREKSKPRPNTCNSWPFRVSSPKIEGVTSSLCTMAK